jgi:hypothetical protein
MPATVSRSVSRSVRMSTNSQHTGRPLASRISIPSSNILGPMARKQAELQGREKLQQELTGKFVY